MNIVLGVYSKIFDGTEAGENNSVFRYKANVSTETDAQKLHEQEETEAGEEHHCRDLEQHGRAGEQHTWVSGPLSMRWNEGKMSQESHTKMRDQVKRVYAAEELQHFSGGSENP